MAKPEVVVESAKGGIQSIEVGYRILRALEESRGPLTLKELAATASMSPSKAHFYLTSFVRLGLVAQSGPGGVYELGPAAIRLGIAALSNVDVVQKARSAMLDLRATTGEAVFLSVWGSSGPTLILRIEGQHWSPLEIRVGVTLKAFSATGRALLAWLPADSTDHLLRRGLEEATPRDRWFGATIEHMRDELKEVRQLGYARGNGSAVEGFHGLAAPIFDSQGGTAAVITLVGNDQSFDTRPGSHNLKSLLEATHRVSDELGARRLPVVPLVSTQPQPATTRKRKRGT